jgi:TetR/AcrR family transcriptional repressor of bet genes
MSRIDVHAIRRKQIIEAAEQLAAQKGWIQTTIADICQKAEISSGVLTYHFKDKDEIMFAALEDMIDRLRERFLTQIGQTETLQGRAIAMIRSLLQFNDESPELYQLLLHFCASSTHQPEIAERLHAFFREIRQHQANKFLELMNKEELPHHDPTVLVSLLQSLALGTILGPMLLGIDLPQETLTEEMTKMISSYL